jgi:predicted amidohydrolase
MGMDENRRMKICVAQTKPIKGDVQSNIDNHKKIIDLAISNRADMIIFPELSITGYEPELAEELATHQDDNRFDNFQKIADGNQVTIAIGVPTKSSEGICISMVIFQPHQPRLTYSKEYIHADEEAFFVAGKNSMGLIGNESNLAIAICYELSVPQHSLNAFKSGAKIYVASVAKSADGVEKAFESLSGIARQYSMTVLMSNCLGKCDNFESAGRSAVWNDRGSLLGQLNDTDEGIIVFDTGTGELMIRTAP